MVIIVTGITGRNQVCITFSGFGWFQNRFRDETYDFKKRGFVILFHDISFQPQSLMRWIKQGQNKQYTTIIHTFFNNAIEILKKSMNFL